MLIPDHEIAQTMQMLGGTFVRALAAAWFVADASNRLKLQQTFADYWQEYTRLAICRTEVE